MNLGKTLVVPEQDVSKAVETVFAEVGRLPLHPAVRHQLQGRDTGIHQTFNPNAELLRRSLRMPQNNVAFVVNLVLPERHRPAAEENEGKHRQDSSDGRVSHKPLPIHSPLKSAFQPEPCNGSITADRPNLTSDTLPTGNGFELD